MWAINEMVEATEAELSEAQLSEAETKGHGCPKAAEEHAVAQAQCPLERAGGVCVVLECEWCDEEHRRGRSQPHESGGLQCHVRGVAGVGKRPVSERHMPSFVSETGERGDGDNVGVKKEMRKDFDLGQVRERLAADRAAEARREQQDSSSCFSLQRAQRNLEKLRADRADKQPLMEAAAQDTRKKGGNKGATPVGLSNRAAPEPVISLRKQGESQRCSLSDEGCLSTPGLVPNSQLAPLGETGRAARQPAQAVASPEPARVTVWATERVQEALQAAVLRVDNPLFESEFKENRLFNMGAEHTVRTAPVQWTQNCQPRPEPSVEFEDSWLAMDGAQRQVNPLCMRAVLGVLFSNKRAGDVRFGLSSIPQGAMLRASRKL